jgi:hypothetical protein
MEHPMKSALMLASAMLACCSGAQASPDGPLSPARKGQLQCYQPDKARKTCAALAGYSWDAKGAITNRAEVLVSRDPLITVTTRTPVSIRGEAVCGPIRAGDLQAADVMVSGAPASPSVAGKVRDGMVSAFSGQIGKEICTAYPAAGDHLQAKITIDGAAHPAGQGATL